jgi:predicted alpha/beta superfamily hydrolase
MGHATLERIERFALAAPGVESPYLISMLRPEGTFDPGSVPIVFVTDADTNFGVAADVFGYLHGLGGANPAVIVGIGYGVSPAEMAQRRTVDLSPPLAAENAGTVDQLASLIGSERGGATGFLDFILGELMAAVVARAPEAAGSGNMLLGHSLGGLFAAHALLTRPEAFGTYAILSPALWWDDFAELRRIGAFRSAVAELDTKPAVFIAVGELEQAIPEKLPPQLAAMGMTLDAIQDMVRKTRMVDAPREFAEMLRDTGIERCTFRLYPDEDHGSVIPAAIGRSLLFALKPEN